MDTLALNFGVCAAIGIVLGWRFKVFILVPSMFLVLCGAAAIGAAMGWKLLVMAGMAIAAVVGLQIGYLLGVVARAATSSVLRRAHGRIAIEALSQHQ
jgi:membrane protein DedA with SNARE-associated domain